MVNEKYRGIRYPMLFHYNSINNYCFISVKLLPAGVQWCPWTKKLLAGGVQCCP